MTTGLRSLVPLLLLVLGAALLPPSGVAADPSRARHHRDVRHHHDRSYPRHGHVVRVLPPHHRRIVIRDSAYFYHRGTFYRPDGPNFVVIAPPIGATVSLLPPGYVTLYLGGFPYYYANWTYYVWDAGATGYRVVAEPEEVDSATAIPSEFFVYPKAGQSEEQLAKDRYECHSWAVKQTGHDPSAGEPLPDAARTEYNRATTACLEARSYSVR